MKERLCWMCGEPATGSIPPDGEWVQIDTGEPLPVCIKCRKRIDEWRERVKNLEFESAEK